MGVMLELPSAGSPRSTSPPLAVQVSPRVCVPLLAELPLASTTLPSPDRPDRPVTLVELPPLIKPMPWMEAAA